YMKAAQIVQFGPPSVITNNDLPQPRPGTGQLLVRVKAAGVGNWDALIREGKRFNSNLCLSFWAPSYLESSKESVQMFQDSRLVTRYTGPQTNNSVEHMQNMLSHSPK